MTDETLVCFNYGEALENMIPDLCYADIGFIGMFWVLVSAMVTTGCNGILSFLCNKVLFILHYIIHVTGWNMI